MLFFGISFAAGIVALLAAQKLDIECLNPPAPKRVKASRADNSAGFIHGAVLLRQQ